MRPTSSLPAPTPRENKGGKLRGEPPGVPSHPERIHQPRGLCLSTLDTVS